MGTVLLQDEPIMIVSNRSKVVQKRKKREREGRIRMAGFDPNISKEYVLHMNKEGFKAIAEEQLRKTNVSSRDPNYRKLGYMKSFKDELTLHPQIWSVLEHFTINEPTPVQMVSIPYITQTKSDLLIHAQTGSGKTLAVLLPIIDYIYKEKTNPAIETRTPNQNSPYAVIVAPSGELVEQLYCEAIRLTHSIRKVGVSFGRGGLHTKDSKTMMNQGCDIVILTPGRLYEYFNSKEGHRAPLLNTKNIKFVVIDEADKVMEPERGNRPNQMELAPMHQIVSDFVINKLTNEDKVEFRAILLSATMNDHLYNLVVDNWIKIDVGSKHPVPTVIQTFVEIENEHKKLELLMEIIESIAEHYNGKGEKHLDSFENPYRRMGKCVIFVNHKVISDRLALSLNSEGFSAISINSDRSPHQRHKIMKDMTRGVLDIVVSTDVLSRGMNIPRVEYVINFDHPQYYSSQEYIHRVGRCGRVGNLGRSITFIDPKRDYSAAASLIEGCEATGQPVSPVLLKCLDYNNYSEHRRYQNVPSNNFFNGMNRRGNNSPNRYDSGIGTHNNSFDESYHVSSSNHVRRNY